MSKYRELFNEENIALTNFINRISVDVKSQIAQMDKIIEIVSQCLSDEEKYFQTEIAHIRSKHADSVDAIQKVIPLDAKHSESLVSAFDHLYSTIRNEVWLINVMSHQVYEKYNWYMIIPKSESEYNIGITETNEKILVVPNIVFRDIDPLKNKIANLNQNKDEQTKFTNTKMMLMLYHQKMISLNDKLSTMLQRADDYFVTYISDLVSYFNKQNADNSAERCKEYLGTIKQIIGNTQGIVEVFDRELCIPNAYKYHDTKDSAIFRKLTDSLKFIRDYFISYTTIADDVSKEISSMLHFADCKAKLSQDDIPGAIESLECVLKYHKSSFVDDTLLKLRNIAQENTVQEYTGEGECAKEEEYVDRSIQTANTISETNSLSEALDRNNAPDSSLNSAYLSLYEENLLPYMQQNMQQNNYNNNSNDEYKVVEECIAELKEEQIIDIVGEI